MTGFLENMKATVDALVGEVQGLKAAVTELQAGAAAAPAAAATTLGGGLGIGGGAVAGGLGGGLGLGGTTTQQTPPPPANVTGEMITALITPYVDNQQIKEALGTEMRAMGINALPETQPHQYGELYQRFQGVINRHAGAAAGAGAAAAAPTSII